VSEKNNELVWNVFYHNSNAKKIEFFNIFDHWKFKEEVEKALKKSKTREELEKAVKSELMRYFWSKYEWEVLITPWPEREDETIKVDVYWQVINNFDRFVDYIARNKGFRKISEGAEEKKTSDKRGA
jgi:hypothetical protein